MNFSHCSAVLYHFIMSFFVSKVKLLKSFSSEKYPCQNFQIDKGVRGAKMYRGLNEQKITFFKMFTITTEP